MLIQFLFKLKKLYNKAICVFRQGEDKLFCLKMRFNKNKNKKKYKFLSNYEKKNMLMKYKKTLKKNLFNYLYLSTFEAILFNSYCVYFF